MWQTLADTLCFRTQKTPVLNQYSMFFRCMA